MNKSKKRDNSILEQIFKETKNIKNSIETEVKRVETDGNDKSKQDIKEGIHDKISNTQSNVEDSLKDRAERCDELIKSKQKELKTRKILSKLGVTNKRQLITRGITYLIIVIVLISLVVQWNSFKQAIKKDKVSTKNSLVEYNTDLTSNGEYTGTELKLSSNLEENKLSIDLKSLSVSMYNNYYSIDSETLNKLKNSIDIKNNLITYNGETYEVSKSLNINTVDCYGNNMLLSFVNSNNTLMREFVIQSADEAEVTKGNTELENEDSETGIKSNKALSNKMEYKENYNGLGFILYDAVTSGEILKDNTLSLKEVLNDTKMNSNIENEKLCIELDGFGKINVEQFKNYIKGTGFYYSSKDGFLKVINDNTNTSYFYIANINNEYINSDCSNYIQVSKEIWKSNNFDNDKAKDYKTYMIKRGSNGYLIKVASDEIFEYIKNQLNLSVEAEG